MTRGCPNLRAPCRLFMDTQPDMDTLSIEARSALMASIKGKDTKPEILVRRLAHALGYRFRLHRRDLPGKPDLSFISLRKVVLVNGCFWHAHRGCSGYRLPKTNRDFWKEKLARNRARDRRTLSALRRACWDTLVVWECETRDMEALSRKLSEFLSSGGCVSSDQAPDKARKRC